ncbi:phosphoesterase [Halobacteriales archaeon QS_3_64_16]|nr:MAG: phosphoesterase [Halobacteriales archaeon QS_3_64_16]
MTASQEAVAAAIEARRERVNEAIESDLPIGDPKRLYEASRYIVDAGGKRLRPTVSLLVAEALCGVEPLSRDYRQFPTLADGGQAGSEADNARSGSREGPEIDLMTAAAGIEVIQSFTLIHDDIMDDDDLRRGVPAVHREYDLETAILAGDTLYAKGFEFMVESGAPPEHSVRALRTLAKTCTSICEGQAMDVAFESRENVSIAEYLRMIERKTAVLYAAAASVPAILVGADDATIGALYDYGLDMGRGFQIQDDLLDLTTPSEQLGKRRGSDLIEGKRTLITLHARERGIDVEELLAEDDLDEGGDMALEGALERLEAAGSIDYARRSARSFVRSSKANLEVVPDNEAQDLLGGIAEFLVERGY